MLFIRNSNYTIAGIALLALNGAAIAWFPMPVIRTLTLAAALALSAGAAGSALFERKRAFAQLAAGLTAILCVYMVLGSAVFWLYRFGAREAYGALVLSTLPFLILSQKERVTLFFLRASRDARALLRDPARAAVNVLALSLCGALLWYLFSHGSLDAIRSPWLLLNQKLFFGAVLLLIGLLWFAAIRASSAIHPLTAAALLLVFLSVGLLVYKVGYGFDPFVHRATERHIALEGLITPKQPYYLGQYIAVVGAAHLSGLGQNALDKLLLPALAALLIVGWLCALAAETWGRRIMLFTLLPILSWFTATTPQGIANLLYILLILAIPMAHTRQISLILPILLAAAVITLHPIALIPALILLFFHISDEKLRRGAVWSTLLSGLLLPALIYAQEVRYGSAPGLLELIQRAAARVAAIPAAMSSLPILQNSHWALFNGVYTLRIAVLAGAVAATVYGIWALRHQTRWLPFLRTAEALTISAALVLLFGELPLVIAYEQSDYALRTLWLISFTLLPFYWYGGLVFLKKLSALPRPALMLAVAILCAAGTANLYLLYPRVDRIVNHRGYSTAQSDLHAVDFIEKQNQHTGTSYAVLANQAVSAAALRQLGFKREIQTKDGKIYNYPVPTGGPLYAFYLEMVDWGPSREAADRVLDYTGTDRVYLVINDYWWRDYRIAALAKQSTDWDTDFDGKLTILAWQKQKKDTGWLPFTK